MAALEPQHAAAHAHHPDDGGVYPHISSTLFYVGIFAALVCLTVLTVLVSYFDFGPGNAILAVLIATAKASLVVTCFMHLIHDRLFNALAFVAAFVFLGIFILLTYDDLGNRGRIDNAYGGMVDLRTGVAAPGGAPATTATIDEVESEAPKGGAGEKKE